MPDCTRGISYGNDTWYTAETDGYIWASSGSQTSNTLTDIIITDNSGNTKYTVGAGGTNWPSFFIPVPSGYKWKARAFDYVVFIQQ